MTYTLLYHPAVLKEDIPKLDHKIAERIGKAIEQKLLYYPERYGSALSQSLKGYWKLRLGDYRVVYKIVAEDIRAILIRNVRNNLPVSRGLL